jgi:hypothetical protein
MDKGVEHFFMYLFATCISSFENCLFKSFAHLSMDFLFECLKFWNPLYIQGIILLCNEWLAKIFSHFVCSLHSVVFFNMQKIFNLIQSNLSILDFIS